MPTSLRTNAASDIGVTTNLNTDSEEERRKNLRAMDSANIKLVESFGASKIDTLADKPDFYTFKNGLVYSHRDFGKFYARLQEGQKSAIVLGFNCKVSLHIGHIASLDTSLFFQQSHGAQVFVPIADDESYLLGRVKDQKEGMQSALELARDILAFGFDPEKTRIAVNQTYRKVYTEALRLSRGITMSEIKAIYGFTNEQNMGIHFFPAIQAAQILMPQSFGIRNTLVPIGPNEDAYLRLCRDVAERFAYEKPAVLHYRFLPGTDGGIMSRKRGNAILLSDDAATVKKKVFSSFSGGRQSLEEHRRLGGDPDVDIALMYLRDSFLRVEDEAEAR